MTLAPVHHSRFSLLKSHQLKGFNLVEAAIVLGVVGLVIGGIWAAANSVTQNKHINDMSSYILQSANAIRAQFPLANYPTGSNTSTYVSATAIQMGILPSSMKPLVAGGYDMAVSPEGYPMWLTLRCYASAEGCPSFSISFAGRSHSAAPSKMPVAECIQIVRKVVSALSRDNNFAAVHISDAGTFNRPVDVNAAVCTNATEYVDFFFRP